MCPRHLQPCASGGTGAVAGRDSCARHSAPPGLGDPRLCHRHGVGDRRAAGSFRSTWSPDSADRETADVIFAAWWRSTSPWPRCGFPHCPRSLEGFPHEIRPLHRLWRPETIVFDDLPIPSPAAGEVLVRVPRGPGHGGDARLRGRARCRPDGAAPAAGDRLEPAPRRPRLGLCRRRGGRRPGVSGFAAGQRVFGLCGFRGGAHRDVLVIRADGRCCRCPTV